jgi:tRNA(Ile)-lysidine synthase
LIIRRVPSDLPVYFIDPEVPPDAPGPFKWDLVEGDPYLPPFLANEAFLDADLLSFPLELRPWRTGDRIRPLGMSGSKLISDILIDAKVPMGRKAEVYVLLSDGTIAWVVGHRIAEGFQLSARTKTAIRIAWTG